MDDDYLWDRSGPVDAEVEALERLLAPYGAGDVAPLRHAPELEGGRRASAPGWRTALATAALLLIAVAGAKVGRVPLNGVSTEDAWELSPLRGRPQVASVSVEGPRRITAGTWIDTDANASARLDVGDSGRVFIAPDSRVRVTRATPDDQRLHLEHGAIDVLIWAPPGQVVVSTPAATAVDLGCAYTLTLDRAGQGSLRVTTGWVGLVHEGREAFVPAGAAVGIHADAGPGTPALVGTSEVLRDAVDRYDTGPTSADRATALATILREASPGDALTLWHLLTRVEPAARPLVFDALALRLAPPDGVTRAGVVAGNRQMLDAWWAALGYGDRAWWTLWLREWRPPS